MPYYTCAVCFYPLINSQRHTCGAKQCLDQWKEWGKFAPAKQKAQKNLSTLSPSERQLVISQGPTQSELDEKASSRELLEADLTAYETQQQKKADSGFLPKSLREALINSAPIKPESEKGGLNEANELSSSQTEKT